jgi:ABC-type Zn2+ transport system substrate-binding protein/surface adhesin
MESLNEVKNRHHRHEGPDHDRVHHDDRPYWKHAHHDWRFWFGLIAILVAIGIYVGTNDLSMVPSGRQKQAPAGSRVP